MVSAAVSLAVVAAGSTVLAGSFHEGRALRTETRLLQELRSAGDVIGRDLRRAGYWGDATGSLALHATGAPASNPYTELVPAAAASDAIAFRLSRDSHENNHVDPDEQYGFRLRHGVIEIQLGGSSWQALTDSSAVVVSTFRITPASGEISLEAYCAEPCAAGSTTCPPRQQVRSLDVTIGARSSLDPRVTRTVQTRVRLRNDRIVGACS
ncbi:hypothetical protein [Schlegelella koreensis]